MDAECASDWVSDGSDGQTIGLALPDWCIRHLPLQQNPPDALTPNPNRPVWVGELVQFET